MRQQIAVMLRAAVVAVYISYTTATTCPCVDGSWEYGGDKFTYCNNPNGVKTAQCLTALNNGGTYTSNLPFTYCEGDVLTVRNKEGIQQANMSLCYGGRMDIQRRGIFLLC